MNRMVLPGNRFDLIFVLVTAAITLWYWAGVAVVPFHPDESTLIFMSADFETYIKNPGSLAWQPASQDPRQKLHLLDAPLGRYLTGISRGLAGYDALKVDWNWGETWEENQAAGALPDPAVLTASRMGTAALFPLSILLIYLTGRRLKGNLSGWVGAIALASNALILLHTRRAMAEGGLTFTVCLFVASLVFCRNHPWLIAISTALAFCAKQSTIPLAAVGMLAVLLYSNRPFQWPKVALHLILYISIWLGIVGLLNPFLWKFPIQSVQAAVNARQILLDEQTQGINQALPEAALSSPGLVILSLVANQFIISPSTAEVGNYLVQTEASTQEYLKNPFHQLFRGIISGGIFLALSVIGFFLSLKLAGTKIETDRVFWLLLAIAGFLQFAALVTALTLPFQRYVIPMIPFTSLWVGLCVQQLIFKINNRKSD